MGNLSRHFSRSEFACKCGCGFDAVAEELVEVLEVVRVYFDAPVRINSACRCAAHNAAVGGEPASKHMEGLAADFTVDGVPPSAVADYLDLIHPDDLGLGRYDRWTHVDTRPGPARWDKRRLV